MQIFDQDSIPTQATNKLSMKLPALNDRPMTTPSQRKWRAETWGKSLADF